MSEASEKGLFGRWQDRRAEKKAELENQSGMDYLVSLPKRLVYV